MKIQLNLIQALRGLAALIVVLVHVSASNREYFNTQWLFDIFKVGWFGVDFFFVLSGFIMVYIHFEDIKNRTNVRRFFAKRFIRIYPIYWVIATISLVFFLFTGKLSLADDLMYIIKSYLLIQQTKMPFLFPAWSLIFEEFFYIVFGLGILCGYKVMKYILPIWLMLIFTVNLIETPFSNYFILNGYILEFLFGCIIGYIFNTCYSSIQLFDRRLFITGVIMLISMWVLSLNFNFGLKGSIESRLIYGLAASLIILGVAIIDSKGSVRMPKSLLILGDSSYSLYLIHQLVLAFVYKIASSIFFQNSYSIIYFAIGLFAVILSISAGILFHIVFEKRIMSFLNKSLLVKKEIQMQLN